MDVTLDGEVLSPTEIKQLLAQSDGLALIRGKWVEIDHDRLRRTLEQFEATARRASDEGLSFGEAMRMVAGAGMTDLGPQIQSGEVL
jgi:non-specific serine/threonine protein kinase